MDKDTHNETATAPKRPIYKRRGFQVLAGIVGVVGLGVGWYLFSPLFLNRTVIEEFPTAAAAVEAPETTATSAETTASVASTGETVTSTEETATDSAVTTEAASGGDAFEPIALAQGEFEGASDRYEGSGTATIYELEDGSRVLRLENFDVTNGPALRVILSPAADPESSAELMGSGYLNLGDLKGNRGDQNYDIPPDAVLPDGEFSIVIYCEPFNVIFATATVSA